MSDETLTLATIERHRDLVRSRLLLISQNLERRALVHDQSKLSPEQFEGFTRINRIAREHAYGSPEYKESMRQEAETIQRHTQGESHHPEFWLRRSDGNAAMGTFLDIIEMVCDWHGAAAAYGGQPVNIEAHLERFVFTSHQEWMIWQVHKFLCAALESEAPDG